MPRSTVGVFGSAQSHIQRPLDDRQYKRNLAHFGTTVRKEIPCGPNLPWTNRIVQRNVDWDGGLPENDWSGLLDAGFVPVECKAGDLLVFCGELDHLSLPNYSDHPRHTFQLHLVEGPDASVTWSPSNWLQYPGGKPFLRLLEER